MPTNLTPEYGAAEAAQGDGLRDGNVLGLHA